ncbi:GGDEF domain-containing protein [Kitasatospora herbaricolor]|uniref:GGDEF domain-containing protein n=1 Tax=Kitasatospora herbaricolor TaxID=68217 RepID=A0ABZ1W0K4_9ACTN|nr:GGDEF domain-containing protein [Kitasatospora herbaricolor]
MAHPSSKVPVAPRRAIQVAARRPGRATPATPATPATGTRAVSAVPASTSPVVPGGRASTPAIAAARALVLARTPAAVRIESLRDSVRRLLEVNRRLRQRLAASLDRAQMLSEERDQLLAELAEARIDPLSGLAGRRGFTRHAAELLREAGTGYCVVLLDLDDFKPVNDTFGHAAGDAVLAAVGERITHWLRPNESAARFGGDEFVVLATYDARLPERLKALREDIAAPVTHEGLALMVGVSMGSAKVTGDLGRALGDADRAMYEAKGSGRRGRRAAAPGGV